MSRNKLYYIKWCDATSAENAWYTKDEAIEWANTENWQIENIGWLLRETKEYILLCTKRSTDRDFEPQFGNLFKIPKTWIRKKVMLNQLKGEK